MKQCIVNMKEIGRYFLLFVVDSFFDDDFTGLLVFNGIIIRFRYDNNNKHNNDKQTNKQN